ncbi:MULTISPECIES: ABC transporter ATP-binding protein [Paenibacillus]|uniref:ABC transporter ATP-binding protein n=1 Tax=Paenibacillus TaxID=44249 RepID=UPI00073ECC95|nr:MULTISPECIES: ABC transporter ATP-binding protein [Paenibacillus]MDU4696598.1 ABC transporter ATP-binding protein [Paenibacillus sp.]
MRKAETVAEVRELRLKFPGESEFVFKDLDFSVQRGEHVLLLGPSGCGKSTLLQVLSGIIPELVEIPMRMSAQQLPSSWRFLFQDPDTQFCMPYVDEELAFALENLGVQQPDMAARMEAALVKVGLDLPELHVPIDSLSQGMKQRLALASVLLGDPEVLLLDEPSALLDPQGREQIWQAIANVAEDRTLIIVEHRIEELTALGLVDRVVLFGPDGRVLGEGAPERVFDTYRSELVEFGIWYPGVWDQYFATEAGRRLLEPVEDGRRLGEPAMVQLTSYCGRRQGRPVIQVGQAAVYPGDWIAITGPNGAGKSSLLLSLINLLPAEGTYVLQGARMETGKLRRRARRRQLERTAREIGFVFQNPEFQFVADRVAEEVAFSLREDGWEADGIDERVAEVLRRFGLTGLESRHPYQLSLGQKRRLSVASAVVREQRLLLLDEPTFGQDAANTFAILQLCESLRRMGTAILMVTHEERIAEQIATQHWEVRDGRLTSQRLTRRTGNFKTDTNKGSPSGSPLPSESEAAFSAEKERQGQPGAEAVMTK